MSVPLTQIKALITGGAGGIGSAIAKQILDAGGAVLLVGRNAAALCSVSARLAQHGERVAQLAADLTREEDLVRVCDTARRWRGGINVLVNNAGINQFELFETQDAAQIEATVAINLLAPMQLCRRMLPHLLAQPAAQILNVGSVFGAIGHPGYVVYSTTKFALRGFSEALRRELAATRVTVHYLAPRATRTDIHSATAAALNAALRVAMDSPDTVAARALRMLRKGEHSAVIGWPERLFVRLNALLPRLVDNALRKQLPIIESHARAAVAPDDSIPSLSLSRKSV